MTAAAPIAGELAVARTGSFRVAWRLVRRDPTAYAIAWADWVLFYVMPIPAGLLLKVVLDHIGSDPSYMSVWAVLAVLGGVEVARWLDLLFSAVQWHGAWVGWHTIPRLNILRSLTVDPGPATDRLPGSPGEAVSRFRDDCQDLAMVLDVWLDVSGAVVSSALAFAIMAAIDLRATVLVALPVVVVLAICRWLGPRLLAWRKAAREATAAVAGFIGDTYGAVTAVKAAGAEDAVQRRFDALGHDRAARSRRDQVGTQLVQTLSGATGNLGTGLALLAIAPRLRAGGFSVGDLGLFTTYIIVLAGLPRWSGRLAAWQRQAEVSVDRLAELLPDRDPAGLTTPVTMRLRHGPGQFPPASITSPHGRTGGDRLGRLDVRGLTVAYPTGGIADIDLTLRRGSFTVITGPVGSGKSTLLRALLGLEPTDGGTRSWNGVVIDDPSTFLVPPRAAYLPQVPRLFSETLADTILLGVDHEGLTDALRVACLTDDLDDMPDGLATVVGPKGVRLSGGQVQRAAAARSLVRRPELLVVDDLSSALDVGTEAEVWRRLLAATTGDTTVLVVTHRRSVIAAADQVVTLADGRVVDHSRG